MQQREKVRHGGKAKGIAVAIVCGVFGMFLYLGAVGMPGVDDGGRYEAFKAFFGLFGDAQNDGDDPDLDGVDNFSEYMNGTDPLNPDTDLDGWPDGLDDDPVSRAVYLWGEPRFTQGDTNVYVRPLWALSGLADGGMAVAGGVYAYGWLLPDTEDRLLMGIDRDLQSNDLWLAVATSDGVSLTAGLLDSNLVSLSPPIELAPSVDPWLTNRLPLSAFADASVVAIRSAQGAALVVASVLYEDADGDGFDDAQNAQLSGETENELNDSPPPPVTGGGVTYTPGYLASILSSEDILDRIGFEPEEGFVVGDLDGQQGWLSSGDVNINTGAAFKGVQYLQMHGISDGVTNTAERVVDVAMTGSVVWVSMRTKCLTDGMSQSGEDEGAVAITFENDRVLAFDGVSRQWKESQRSFPGIMGEWVRVDVRLDYASKTYTLCVRGMAAHRDLGFVDPTLTRPTSLSMRNDSANDVSLDEIVFSEREPEGLDFDGDGILNSEERMLGSDVWSDDSDGDGIPDAVELRLGGDPAEYSADFDGDGITNEDERAFFGTDPTLLDSDGNGIPDGYVVADLPGAGYSWISGGWQVTGNDRVASDEGALNRAGYEAVVPRPGFHLVEFHLAGLAGDAEDFHLALSVDDAEIARFAAPVPADGGVWQVRTPWLPEGTNRFRLAWIEGVAAGRRLEIARFRVIGVDADVPFARAAWCADVSTRVVYTDADGDSLADITETRTMQTFTTRFDSDGDGLWDGDELRIFRLDPLSRDSDGDGLPDATVVSERAGIETATRTVTHITTDFTEIGGALVWADSTASSCAYDLFVVSPGFHVLEIDVRNETYDPPDGYAFEFRASLVNREIGALVCKGDIGHAGTARLITPWLPEGGHRFSLSWKNRVVQGARASRPALERIRLIEVNGADTDGDGIQDWMKDRLMASASDSDGDGIKDRDEILIHFSNPLAADTDGDGLSDKDELALGTDLNNPDTDGDGLSDGDEVHGAGSDPLSAEFSGVWTPIHTRAGCETVLRDGPAYSSDGDLVLTGRGNIEYLFNLPVSEKPLMKLSGRHELRAGPSTGASSDTSDFIVYADGQFIGRYFLRDTQGDFTAVLPFMKAGAHRIRLSWNTLNPLLSARICSVALGSLGGADSDGDGVRDWITAAASRTNRVAVAPATSPLSPACLEGTARWPLLASAVSGAESVPVQAGVAGRWFADLPLAPSGEPTPLNIAFENGASTAAVTVAWVPLNLLAAPDQMAARLGDTLRVTVAPSQGTQGSAAVGVTVDGAVRQSLSLQSGGTLEIPFDADGIWTLSTVWTGTGGDRISRTLTVRVYAAPLPDGEPACLLGRQRDWSCPGITPGAVFQTDSGVKLAWNGTNASLTVNSMYAEHFIVARAGTGGPVLGSRRINPFWIQSAPDSFLRVVEVRASSQVWENHMATLGLPADVEVEVRIIVGGVTFDDLSLVRWYSGGALPGAADTRFRLIHPNSSQASTCHTIKAYQGGVFLGEAYHAGVGLPNDLR